MKRTVKWKGAGRGKARKTTRRAKAQGNLVIKLDLVEMGRQASLEEFWSGRNHAMRRSARIAA